MNPRSDQLALLPDDPHVCPACGGVEPNAFLLDNNHGVRDGLIGGWQIEEHPIYGGRCVRQVLLANHVAYARKNGTPGDVAARVALARDAGLAEEYWT